MTELSLARSESAASYPVEASYVRRSLPVVAVGLLLGILSAETPQGDTDVLWGARAGMDMLSSGTLPHHATHSWTAAGHSWTPNSWGWDVLLGALYRLGSLNAIGVLEVAILTAIGFLIALTGLRRGASAGWIAVAFTIIGRLELADLRARPQAVGYLMIFAIPLLLPRVLSGDRRTAVRAAAAICGLQILWINLHSTGLLGPVMVGAGGAGLLLRDHVIGAVRRRRLMRLGALMVATALACLATPYGMALVANVQEVRNASVGLISEWEPAGVHDSNQILGLVAIGFAMSVAYAAWRGRRYDTVVYLVLLATATASAVRFTPLLLLMTTPELALLLGRIKLRESFLRRMVVAGCLVLAVFTVIDIGKFGATDPSVTSPRLVAQIPHGCRTVNDYTIGGALLLARPDVQVSVDGRNDMYGRRLLLSVEGMLSNTNGTIARLDANQVDCVLTDSGNALVDALKRLPNWRIAGTDAERTLLLRITP